MLDGFQLAVVAHECEHGSLFCDDCAQYEYTKPVIQYSLDEIQAQLAEDGYSDEEGHVAGCGCEPELSCEGCGTTLAAAWLDPDCQENGADNA